MSNWDGGDDSPNEKIQASNSPDYVLWSILVISGIVVIGAGIAGIIKGLCN